VATVNLAKHLEGHAFVKQMNTFPGPLSPSTSADKVLKFIKEGIKSDNDISEDSQLLWDAVKLVIQNVGDLSSTEKLGTSQAEIRNILALTAADQIVKLFVFFYFF
jgi:hypothetical protein